MVMQIFVSLVCLMFLCDFGFLLPELLQLTFLFFTSLLPCGQLYEYCALDLDKCLVKPANRDGRHNEETVMTASSLSLAPFVCSSHTKLFSIEQGKERRGLEKVRESRGEPGNWGLHTINTKG